MSPLNDVLEGVQEVDAVLVALEYGLPLIAPGGDMIHGAGIFDSQGTGHEKRISEVKMKVKHSIPDPQMFREQRHLGFRFIFLRFITDILDDCLWVDLLLDVHRHRRYGKISRVLLVLPLPHKLRVQ